MKETEITLPSEPGEMKAAATWDSDGLRVYNRPGWVLWQCVSLTRDQAVKLAEFIRQMTADGSTQWRPANWVENKVKASYAPENEEWTAFYRGYEMGADAILVALPNELKVITDAAVVDAWYRGVAAYEAATPNNYRRELADHAGDMAIAQAQLAADALVVARKDAEIERLKAELSDKYVPYGVIRVRTLQEVGEWLESLASSDVYRYPVHVHLEQIESLQNGVMPEGENNG